MQGMAALETVFGSPGVFAIHAVLREGNAEAQIAILVGGAIVAEVAVLVSDADARILRCLVVHRLELREERSLKGEFPS